MTGAFVCFCSPEQGIVSWQARELARLCSLFKSQSTFVNIRKGREVSCTETLSILATGTRPNDVCLLLIEGDDAELMCLVLAEYTSKHWHLLSTSAFAASASRQSVPPFNVANSTIQLKSLQAQSTQYDTLLREIANLVAPANILEQTCAAFQRREAQSSTYIDDHIALPHIIDTSIVYPTIVLTRCQQPIIWSNDKSVVLCVAIALPSQSERETLRAISQLSRHLSSSAFRQWLTHCDDAPTQLTLLGAVLDQD